MRGRRAAEQRSTAANIRRAQTAYNKQSFDFRSYDPRLRTETLACLDALGSDSALEAPQRDLCATLEYLLCAYFTTVSWWKPEDWCDGILPLSLKQTGPQTLELFGEAMWGKHGANWFDPVFARIELTPDRMSVHAYELKFGNAEIGLRKVPNKWRRLRNTQLPAKWVLQFKKPDV